MSKEIYPYEPEFSFRDIFEKRKADFLYLWQSRFKIIAISILGAVFGIVYAWLKPISYTAKLSFVVEEAKGGGGSLISGLAGQLGFDIGGISGTGGVLAGDNVQQLLRSNKMIKNTLLSPYDEKSNITIADQYAKTAKLSQTWGDKYNNGTAINFPANPDSYSRLQDSLLQVIILRIKEKELAVGKTDKKLSFFEASVTMHNEKVAQLFTLRLIDQATNFYIETKTKRQKNNINRLQARADSIENLLNRKTYTAIAANEIMLDKNPAYVTQNVNIELKQRDKTVLQSIYAEIVKNLEVSRTLLLQETPTFQIVDEPELPLLKNRTGYLKSIVYGMMIMGLIACLYVLITKSNSSKL